MRRRRRRPHPAALLLVLLLAGCAEAPKVALPTPTGPPALTAAPLPAGTSTTAVTPPSARLAAQPLAGPVAAEVRLSGEGYPAHGRVVFTFHGERVGDTTADAVGRFVGALVRVPESFRGAEAGTQVTIGATSGPFYAEVPFVLTR
ncbi:hypothetical protein [Saccharothrix syringae]|uniref:Bacterial spore germination immunoglobulin-like domain-containing protein n=1 Tax=Saccharothrix syringae TaxID=103733 RepID=A0A5Q0H9N9_SACSY|nr:hypothetical protein [Saccharothrix syringae]QFZ22957.1 hypothetical protein EKG83_40930 [Saccharothrix syringae]